MIKCFFAGEDKEMCSFVKGLLELHEFSIHTESRHILAELYKYKPDMIIIDENLGEFDDQELLSQLRKDPNWKSTPIVMLTSNYETEAMLGAYKLGIEDYFIKPLLPEVFIEKIKVISRRTGLEERYKNRYIVDDIEIINDRSAVTINNQYLTLTRTEYLILKEVLTYKDKNVSREFLIAKAFPTENVTKRTVDVHICSLRKKMGEVGQRLKTIRGVGYRYDSVVNLEESFAYTNIDHRIAN